MTRPTVASQGRVGQPRPDPRPARWSTVDLARRRSLATARAELSAALDRGDPAPVIGAWRAVVAAMARAERARTDAP